MDTIEQMLTELDASRERLLVAIEPLPDEVLAQPGLAGGWSVADVLANLTAWESELVTALRQVAQGKKPARLLAALANAETYSQERYAENKGRDLERVFDDWMKVRLELEERLESFSDRDLADRQRFNWLHGRALSQLIAQITSENEQRYLPALEHFAGEWRKGN